MAICYQIYSAPDVIHFLTDAVKINVAQWAGFEHARADPNRFLVCRLNHSATTAWYHQVGIFLDGWYILPYLLVTLSLWSMHYGLLHWLMEIEPYSWKTFVRSGIRTHTWRTRLRPERNALDHSAVLTWCTADVSWTDSDRNPNWNAYAVAHVTNGSWP